MRRCGLKCFSPRTVRPKRTLAAGSPSTSASLLLQLLRDRQTDRQTDRHAADNYTLTALDTASIASCDSNGSDSPHHLRRRTDRSILFVRWRQYAAYMIHAWFLGPTRVRLPSGISIGSSVFAGHSGSVVTNKQTYRPQSVKTCVNIARIDGDAG